MPRNRNAGPLVYYGPEMVRLRPAKANRPNVVVSKGRPILLSMRDIYDGPEALPHFLELSKGEARTLAGMLLWAAGAKGDSVAVKLVKPGPKPKKPK